MKTLQISSFVHISNEKPLLPYSTPPSPSTYSILVIVICFASRSLVRPFASPRSPIVARRSLLVAIIAAKEKKKAKRKPLPPPTASATATPTTTTTLPKAKPLKTTGRQSNALNPALPLQLSVLFRHRRQGLHCGAGLCPRGGSQESRPGRQGGA